MLKPHVGWPDNLSLMYWAACGGHVECAKLLIQYGVGVHHELPIKGNGERGTTSLQEAVALSHWGKDPSRLADRLAVARILIEDGAYYDIYSACALNDTARLQELIEEDPDRGQRHRRLRDDPASLGRARRLHGVRERCCWNGEASSTP